MAPTRRLVQKDQARSSFLKIRGLTTCRVQWSPVYGPSYLALNILSDSRHVFYRPTVDKYKNRVREGLWWQVTANSLNALRCLRSHGSRRLRVAVTEALLAKGYDKEGRLLDSSGAGRVGVKLRGSMQILGLKPCIDIEWAEVQKQAGLILDKIMEVCQGSKQ